MALLSMQAGAQTRKSDTSTVYFHLADPSLNWAARHKLDSLVGRKVFAPEKFYLIIGYCDYLGSEAYNEVLSRQRAGSVMSYLISRGIPKTHVQLCIGRGEIYREETTPDGYPVDRKVDIVPIRKLPYTDTFVSKTGIRVTVTEPAQPPPKKTPPRKPTPPVATVPPPPPVKTREDELIRTLKPGDIFTLNNIYFFPGRHTIRPQSLPELDNLYNALAANPKVHISIEGHVCCIPPGAPDAIDEDVTSPNGTMGYRTLSVNRAHYIYNYLIGKGIDRKRLQYKGFGRSRPLVPVEVTANDENRNRRVEVRILKK